MRKLFRKKNEELHYEISPIVKKLEKNMEILSNVDLSNKRDDERIMVMNELGRKDYLHSLNKLINSFKNKENNIEQLTERLEKFIFHSSKSYAKATLLIGKEVENIVKDITIIKNILENFKKSNGYLLEKKNKKIKLISMYEEKINNEKIKSDTLEEIEKSKKISEKNGKELDEINEKIKSIKNSRDYKKSEKLADSRNKKEEMLKTLKLEIGLLIDKRVLKKYIYIEDNDNKKIAEEYLEQPADKLISDQDLKIADILVDVKEKVKGGILEVKEPSKIIEKLTIPKEVFIKYRDDISKLINEIKEIEDKIKKIEYNLSDLSDLIRNKTKIEDRISENNSNLAILYNKLDKIEKSITDLEEGLVIEINKL